MGTTMTERLDRAGFADESGHGLWVRDDDVYETVVSRDEPGLWAVAVYNHETDAPDEPVRFRLRDDGTVHDVGDGISAETAAVLYNDLRQRPLPDDYLSAGRDRDPERI